MKHCPICHNTYPETYQFCPTDGDELLLDTGEEPYHEHARPHEPEHERAQISVRTLMLSIATLVIAAVLAFGGVFFYQYLKPKYGELVVKTTPSGATIFVDGKQRGPSPITVSGLRSGGHHLKVVKEGFKDLVQQVEVMPYATENLHYALDPLVPHLTNEQLADVESWRKKLDSAQRENILLPPPDDYNVLYFINKILAIDPANSYALEAKSKLAEQIRSGADLSYAREDWLEAEKQYKNLALIYPDDIAINERLADIATKIDASIKDREKQIEDWHAKAEAAIKAGTLLPPEKDNAFDAVQNILRLDRKNVYARGALAHVKELLQTHGDIKMASGDWQGARNDFKLVLQYFPEDSYSKARMSVIEGKLSELAQADQQRAQRMQEEQQSKQKISSLRQTAIASFRAGSFQKAVSEWQEYLKLDASSDEAYYYLGMSYQEQKQLDTAILNFEKCISLNPGNAPAHFSLGLLYDRHRNDPAQAIEHLKKAKELGGVEKYSPDKIQAMIKDLQDRIQLNGLQKTPFAAEHKHAFSNCRGSLLIEDDGVEYKTTETDHSFYETYGGLRSFSIVGDDITLRTRNNKKYNFHLLNPGDGAKVRQLATRHTQITD